MSPSSLASWIHRAWLPAWAAFAAWCVSGIPPAVDLPAHAAQMQTLAELVRWTPDVSRVYEAGFPVGYGLAALSGFRETARAGRWRRLDRP